ncbi:choice-of-anchor D domain-containing protein, partial [Bacteroidota bacterium]
LSLRKLKLYFSLILINVLCISILAQDAYFTKLPSGQAPVIDGIKESLWDGVELHNINTDYVGESPTLDSATWQAVWNDTAIFILVYVEDDIHCDQWCTGNSDWQSDGVEIYFDVNVGNLDDGNGPMNQPNGHIQFAWGDIGFQQDVDQNFFYGMSWMDLYVSSAYNISDPDYTYEFAIPFSSLVSDNNDTLNPYNFSTFGFDVYIIDADGAGDPRDRAVWKNNGNINEAYVNMDDCGEVIFCEGVFGHAKIDVSDSCLNFGDVFENGSNTKTLDIYNLDCEDSLFITNITSSLSEYSVNQTTDTVLPGSSASINVTFNPTTVGTFDGNLTIYTNDIDTVICLEGNGVGAPEINVIEDSFNIAFSQCVDSTYDTLRIYNIGASNLDYDIIITDTNGLVAKVYITIYTDIFGGEISWDLRNSTNVIVASGSGYSSYSTYIDSVMLPPGDYTFNSYDSYGDGWNGGTYEVTSCSNLYANNDGNSPSGTGETETFTLDNCVNPSLSWIIPFSNSGTVIPGDSALIGIKLRTTDLNAGTHNALLFVNSNDPLLPVDTVFCELILSGESEIVLSDACFDFGDVFAGGSITDTLLIYNTGCDTLKIPDITNTITEYTVDNTTLNILPRDSAEVLITFMPSSIATFNGNLTIINNDTDTVICLEGNGIAAPEMSFNTDSIEISITECNDTLTDTLTIYNDGGNDLSINILEKEDIDSTSTQNYTTDGETTNHIFQISNFIPESINLEVTINGDFDGSGEFASLYIDGEFICQIDDGNLSNGTDIITNYTFSGSDVINWLSDYQLTVSIENDFSVGPFVGTEIHSVKLIVNYNSWITTSINSDIISPGDSTKIGVTFYSNDLTGGIHNDYVIINSNDPLSSIDSICCQLELTGNPELSLSDTCFDFENVYQNSDRADTFVIFNTGCDTLQISDITASLSEFTIDTFTATIAPFDSGFVIATFEPTGLGAFNGTLNIYSNDVDTSLNIKGTGSANIHVYSDITSDTSFCEDTIIIHNNITIDDDVTLTICPGALVQFNGHYRLNVQGTLLAEGTVTDSITFTAIDQNEGWHGMRFNNTPSTNDSSKLKYCKLEYSKATGTITEDQNGGALFINNFNKLIVSNCDINNNYAQNIGGAIYISSGSFIIDSCNINNNSANSGGGIFASNSSSTYSNNIISNNSANSGGGIYENSTSTTIINNIISNNYASSQGGGINFEWCYTNPLLVNNLITDNNAANDGGGLYFYYSGPVMVNNTISMNDANRGGGFFYYYTSSNSVDKNSIIWGNTATSNGQQVYFYSDDSDPEFTYCNIQGGSTAFEGNGSGASYAGTFENNIDTDPDFVDAANQDYSLSNTSICINTGTPDTTGLNIPTTDLAGNPRIYNSGTIDIGAYENQSISTNRKPALTKVGDQQTSVSTTQQQTVIFTDADGGDSHTISVVSDNGNVTVQNLSSTTTSGATYDLVPSGGWSGTANITVTVTDNSGEGNDTDSEIYQLVAANTLCGSISSDTTWDGAVFIGCDITVEDNVTLTIDPGTYIEFTGHFRFDVQGTLLAEGTSIDSITFTASDQNEGWYGIRFNNTLSSNDSSKIKYCKLEYSKATGGISEDQNGGALYINTFDKLILSNCNISNNYALRHGGGIYLTNSSLILDSCNINNNSTGSDWSEGGGGIANAGNLTITNSTISDNYSLWHGGGIYNISFSANLNLINCKITDNTAVQGGGGIGNMYASAINITNCVISENTATGSKGGGIHAGANYSGTANITNSTIYNNSSGNSGGGLFNQNATFNIVNTIIAGNTDNNGYPDIYINGSLNSQGYNLIGNVGNQSYAPGTGDLVGTNSNLIDPRLNTDFTLQNTSICINAGTPDTSGLSMPTVDLAGNSRIYDGTTDRIDIGAYELQSDPTPTYEIMVSDLSIAFGYVTIDSSAIENITINNIGHGDLTISSITAPTGFEVKTEGSGTYNSSISSFDLKAHHDTIINVAFSPTLAQNYNDNLEINSNDADEPTINVTASGIGTSALCVQGAIDDDSTLCADTIRITGDLTIEDGVTLTICPGTYVEYTGHHRLNIQGTILAEGTNADSITFTALDQNEGWYGMRFNNTPSTNDTSKLKYCILEYSKKASGSTSEDQNGGALFINSFDKLKVSNCDINNNYALNYGGAIYITNSSLALDSCNINNNSTGSGWSEGGGGVANAGDLTITNSTISDNNSQWHGGGIYNFSSSSNLDLTNCKIADNTAQQGGGGIGNYYASTINIINCAISGNIASSRNGGGIHAGANFNGTATITSSTIYNNSSGNTGGGIHNQNATFNITNTIIAENTDNSSYPDICINGLLNSQGYNLIGNVGDQSYTPGTGDLVGTNSNSIDPRLNSDLTLQNTSICINGGTTDTIGLSIPTVDLAGNPRIYDGTTDRIDMGAYELQSDPAPTYEILVSPLSIAFGYETIDSSANDNITINNIGHGDLTISSITAPTGYEVKTEGSGTYISTISSFDLKAHHDTIINVAFIPTLAQNYSGNIVINSNDADEPAINVSVSGDGTSILCIEGSITANRTLCEDTIYITDDLTIENGVTLTICPGTYIEYTGHFMLDVQGTLLAEGTLTDSITITAMDQNEGWHGIRFNNTSSANDSSKLNFCNLEYGKASGGVNGEGDACGGALYLNNFNKLIVTNCNINNNYALDNGGGIFVTNSNLI